MFTLTARAVDTLCIGEGGGEQSYNLQILHARDLPRTLITGLSAQTYARRTLRG